MPGRTWSAHRSSPSARERADRARELPAREHARRSSSPARRPGWGRIRCRRRARRRRAAGSRRAEVRRLSAQMRIVSLNRAGDADRCVGAGGRGPAWCGVGERDPERVATGGQRAGWPGTRSVAVTPARRDRSRRSRAWRAGRSRRLRRPPTQRRPRSGTGGASSCAPTARRVVHALIIPPAQPGIPPDFGDSRENPECLTRRAVRRLRGGETGADRRRPRSRFARSRESSSSAPATSSPARRRTPGALAAVAVDAPDAVLLDVQLPDQVGFSVATALAARGVRRSC